LPLTRGRSIRQCGQPGKLLRRRRCKPACRICQHGHDAPFLGPSERCMEQRELQQCHEGVVHDVNAVAVHCKTVQYRAGLVQEAGEDCQQSKAKSRATQHEGRKARIYQNPTRRLFQNQHRNNKTSRERAGDSGREAPTATTSAPISHRATAGPAAGHGPRRRRP